MDKLAVVKVLESLIRDEITDEDTRAWHAGELTPHLERIVDALGEAGLELQVWGVKNPLPGEEPLRIVVR